MNRRLLLAGFGGLLTLSALPTLAQDKTYTLIFKHTQGEMAKYKLVMDMTIQIKDKDGKAISLPGMDEAGMKMKMGGTLVQKTKAVKADGGATLSGQMREGTMEVMGQSNSMPEGIESITEVDKLGKVLKMETSKDGEPMNNPFMGMMQMDKMTSMGVGIVYPDKPVKVGDKWEQTLPGMVKGSTLKVLSKVLGIEQIDGKEALQIKQYIVMPLDMGMDKDGQPAKGKGNGMSMTGSMTIDALYSISTADARVLKTVNKIKGTMRMNLPKEAAQQSPFGSTMNMGITGVMTQSLLSVGKVEDDKDAKPAVRACGFSHRAGCGRRSSPAPAARQRPTPE